MAGSHCSWHMAISTLLPLVAERPSRDAVKHTKTTIDGEAVNRGATSRTQNIGLALEVQISYHPS